MKIKYQCLLYVFLIFFSSISLSSATFLERWALLDINISSYDQIDFFTTGETKFESPLLDPYPSDDPPRAIEDYGWLQGTWTPSTHLYLTRNDPTKIFDNLSFITAFEGTEGEDKFQFYLVYSSLDIIQKAVFFTYPVSGTGALSWVRKTYTGNFDSLPIGPLGAPVPEPATMFLFCIGLLSIAGVSRKKK